jgi:hypothetical protein
MATDDDLIDKADTLIQRRRIFVAGGGVRQPETHVTTTEASELPVLTEIVDASWPPAPVEPPIPPVHIDALAKALLQERLPVQQQLLADNLAGWLDTELPQVVMRVLDGLSDQMITQVTTEARASLLPRLQAVLEVDHPAKTEGS